jgi:DnaJ-class molecular chaperone
MVQECDMGLPLDHYSTLGVQPNASRREIESAYQAMCKASSLWSLLCGRGRSQLDHAYEVLADPVRRADYDAMEMRLMALWTRWPM